MGTICCFQLASIKLRDFDAFLKAKELSQEGGCNALDYLKKAWIEHVNLMDCECPNRNSKVSRPLDFYSLGRRFFKRSPDRYFSV